LTQFRKDIHASKGNGSKLKIPDDYIEIRRRCAAGERQVDIAKDFGIARTTVSQINTGKIGKFVGDSK
jgi:hypothetical protein